MRLKDFIPEYGSFCFSISIGALVEKYEKFCKNGRRKIRNLFIFL